MKKSLSLAFVLLTACVMASCSDDTIPVGDEWIDPDFAFMLQKYGYIEDAKTVTPPDVESLIRIDVSSYSEDDRKIKSLRGIKYFKSLRELDCEGNELTSLDLSGNPMLVCLHCGDCNLKDINLTQNTELRVLSVSYNQLSSLDVSQCILLQYLYCHENKLTDLNLSGLDKLTDLYCNDNLLTGLDLSENRKLYTLSCAYNPGLNNRFKIWYDPKAEYFPFQIPGSSYYWWDGDYWSFNGKYVEIEFVKAE